MQENSEYWKHFDYSNADKKSTAFKELTKADKGVITVFFSEFNRLVDYYHSSIAKITLPKEVELKLAKTILETHTVDDLNTGLRVILTNDYCNGRTSGRKAVAKPNWFFKEDVFNRAIKGELD